MYSETRRFKHDYINMLSPLKEYIDNEDIEGLSEFFIITLLIWTKI
ncbi:hypothetical protein JQ038_18775 [Clostridium botulinum]|nr:hypothetical protein [Clostridium botulinum]